VSVRADEHVVADPRRVPLAPADQRVFHDHAARADVDRAVLGRQHRADQDPRVRADAHVAAEDRVRRHVGARIDLRRPPAVLEEHQTGVAETTMLSR
jgi:hypothetical protein